MSVKKETKAAARSRRCHEANALILEVASRGRRFFRYSGREGVESRTARFEVTASGRVRFRDDGSDRLIDTSKEGRWWHFSHGGTLQRLVAALGLYVSDGIRIRPNHFGPWPEYLCDGDLWGYGDEAMRDLRAALSASPCISRSVRPAAAEPVAVQVC